ncbi:MSHA biogenesis protein MshP [Aeromonas allosaccharophila]|uniref:MSHA biogenesis protein MshP n=1 Tax=Aeromonas allosaccharophila TaxID=656 RepID=UPI001F1FDCE9|nr:MSHA biogenesis protein MshP [Aeromonas allosaccharophila]MCE9848990.1 MSHA biogenesis protein MshP [Aeromonas allosaccharophila]
MIALFVIVVMALLAAAMGRFLVDSGEKNTVEVRSVRALLAAQSGLEVALYRLFPNRTLAQPTPPAECLATSPLNFASNPGLTNCLAVVRCATVPVTYNGSVTNGYRLESVGTCGNSDLNSANPDFAVSRTLMVEAYDGGTP